MTARLFAKVCFFVVALVVIQGGQATAQVTWTITSPNQGQKILSTTSSIMCTGAYSYPVGTTSPPNAVQVIFTDSAGTQTTATGGLVPSSGTWLATLSFGSPPPAPIAVGIATVTVQGSSDNGTTWTAGTKTINVNITN